MSSRPISKIMSCTRKMKKPFLVPLQKVINQKTLSLAVCFFFPSETKPDSLPFNYSLYSPITGVYRCEGLVLVDSTFLLSLVGPLFSVKTINSLSQTRKISQLERSRKLQICDNPQSRNMRWYRINHGNQNKANFWRVEKKTSLVTKLACRCEPPASGECHDLQPVDISRQTGSP